jgi:ribosomal protein L16 Arg81 hydroxylase
MILIGQKHTMFNLHTDNVDSATWQAQIKGRKRWRVCPPSETPFLYEGATKRDTGSSDLNTFTASTDQYPLWAYARCYDYVAKPGDVLYYPPNYWHQTMNLDDETIALTSRVMHPTNFNLVFNKFKEECAKPPYKVPAGYEPPPRLSS